MTRKLFAFDIDGTLVDHKDHLIPESALKALQELKKQGHIIGIATGRNKLQLEKAIDFSIFDFAIMCNGSYGEVHGECVLNNKFSEEKVEKVLTLLEQNNYEYLISTEHHLYGKNPYTSNVKRVIDQFDLVYPDMLSDLNNLNVFQIVVCEPINTVNHLKSIQDDVLFHTFGDFGYDIDQKGITKGSTLPVIAKHFQIEMKDVYAFGDAPNDVELIKIAGIGVALGNAFQIVKDVADYITTDIGDNGIYNALRHFGFVE